MKPFVKKAAAVACGIFAALVLGEVFLRIAAAFANPVRALPAASRPGAPLAVFVGDSHIYGLWVGDHEALPNVTEKLAVANCSPGICSINLGRCGAPTWVTLADGLDAIARFKPAVMICRSGFNNSVAPRPRDSGILSNLRIVKFMKIAAANFRGKEESDSRETPGIGKFRGEIYNSTDPVAFHVEPPSSRPDVEASSAERVADFIKLARAAKEANCKLIFLSYLDPSPVFQILNEDLRRAAKSTGAIFIDMEPLGRAAIAQGDRSEFLCDDGHPGRAGYEMEARMLVNGMIDAGILAGARAGDPLEWYLSQRKYLQKSTAAPTEFHIQKSPAGDITFEVTAAPSTPGWICIGAESESGFEYSNLHIPVEKRDAVASGGLPGFQFTTDKSGRARVAVDADTKAKIGERYIAFALLVDTSGPVRRDLYSKAYYIFGGGPAKEQVRVLR